MPDEMRPLYLISGTDGSKIEATRQRLRARAEREGGDGALEVFEPSEGRGAPDHEALLAAIPAMSLMGTRRYLLADGVEKWRDKQQAAVAEAIGGELPPDLTLVLIARAKAPAKLLKAVKKAKGEIHNFEAPKARDMPRVLVGDAQRLGFKLDPAAARLLVERMGAEPLRLHNELERLALWAGDSGQVTAADLEEMIADTSEAAVWTLSDAVIEGDARTALRVGEQLIEQGENVTGLIYGLVVQAPLRLHRGGDAGGGRVAARGRRQPENAPLRGEAPGRPPAEHRRRRTSASPPRPSPNWSAGAAATRTTATSWLSPSRCATATGATA